MEALQTVRESGPSLSQTTKIEEEKQSQEIPSVSQMYSQMTNYDKVRIILQRRPEQRTREELELLLPLIKQIQFFKEREFKEEQIKEIGSYLRYQRFRAGEDVVVYGQIGNKFYIMLDGEVSVNLPSTPEVAAKLEARYSMSKKRPPKIPFPLHENLSQASVTKSVSPTHKEQVESNPGSHKYSKIQSYISSSIMTPIRSSLSNHFPTNKSTDSLMEAKVEDQHTREIERLTRLAYDDNIPIKYIQVATLSSGASFGELGLIKNKPRAATIRCLVDCEFAVVDRYDYKQVIGKLEQTKMNKIVDFLGGLPYFINWTRHAVAKLHYFFNKKVIKRGQFLFSEGEIAEYAYLVMDGELQAYKLITKLQRRELDLEKILEHSHEQKARLFKGALESQRRFHAKVALQANGINKNHQKVRIAQMMHGQMIGEEDLVRSITTENPVLRRYNVQCISASGTLLAIKKSDFMRRCKPRQDTWNLILKSSKIKDTQFSMKVENEAQIKVHKELELMPQLDKKRKEESPR